MKIGLRMAKILTARSLVLKVLPFIIIFFFLRGRICPPLLKTFGLSIVRVLPLKSLRAYGLIAL